MGAVLLAPVRLHVHLVPVRATILSTVGGAADHLHRDRMQNVEQQGARRRDTVLAKGKRNQKFKSDTGLKRAL